MRPSTTVYRGARLYDRQVITGVRVTVNGHPLSPERSRKVRDHASCFEWSYSGAGPDQLALAPVLDATGDIDLALRTYRFFKWGVVRQWSGDSWSITAEEIRHWVSQAERETPVKLLTGEEVSPPVKLSAWLAGAMQPAGQSSRFCQVVKRCHICGCTDADCRQCISASGVPCAWVEGEEPPICSRCADEQDAELILQMEGGAK